MSQMSELNLLNGYPLPSLRCKYIMKYCLGLLYLFLFWEGFFTLLQLLNISFLLLLEACFTSSTMVIQLCQSLHNTSSMPQTAQWAAPCKMTQDYIQQHGKTYFIWTIPPSFQIPSQPQCYPSFRSVIRRAKHLWGEKRLFCIQHLHQV